MAFRNVASAHLGVVVIDVDGEAILSWNARDITLIECQAACQEGFQVRIVEEVGVGDARRATGQTWDIPATEDGLLSLVVTNTEEGRHRYRVTYHHADGDRASLYFDGCEVTR